MNAPKERPVDILEATHKKLTAAIEKIESTKQLGFPHNDSIDALDQIKGVFFQHREELKDKRSADPSIQITFCRRAIEQIDLHMPIIGFIARSADLEGAVELHGPLLDLTRRALGSEARLVMASEWDYSPLTILFPEFSVLGYVLVGLPACEANNTLLTPLAGHELGHNIWLAQGLDRILEDKAEDAIIQTILEEQSEFVPTEIRSDESRLRDLDGQTYWLPCWMWLRRQCEEVFCDFIGLLIFREAFLHATEYLLAPTLTGKRSYEYPGSKSRAKALVMACERENPKIKVSENYIDLFDNEKILDADVKRVGLSDTALNKMLPILYEEAKKVVTDRKLELYSEAEIERISQAFKLIVPATSAQCLSDIVNAAWRVSLEPENFLTKVYPGAKPENAGMILNELVLKSFEVLEIERIGKLR